MSTTTIEQDIKDSIAKNLPAQVGEVLKARLEQADKDSKEVKKLSDALNKEIILASNYLKDITNLKEQLNKHDDLNKREKELISREIRLEVEMLKKDVLCEQRITQNMNITLSTVFRNPRYQETHFETSSQPVTSGGYTALQQATHTNTTTKSVE